MRVEQLGEGEPELAVVGSIHGDEPCGAHAIETLLAENPAVKRPVKCIIANEPALEQGVRFIETDANRVFPGDSEADTYEIRLASHLLDELRGCTTLSMHSTQSYEGAFAIVDETGPLAETICPHLSIETIVEAAGEFPNALVNHATVIEVECGRQGSDQAAKNAVQLVREFLSATGVLPEPEAVEPTAQALPVYQIDQLIPKQPADSYTVHVENFERVTEGTRYATVDEQELIAEEPFYPVLMSAEGYDWMTLRENLREKNVRPLIKHRLFRPVDIANERCVRPSSPQSSARSAPPCVREPGREFREIALMCVVHNIKRAVSP